MDRIRKNNVWKGIKHMFRSPTGEVIERLNHSRYSLKDVVLEAHRSDSAAFSLTLAADDVSGNIGYSTRSVESLVEEFKTDLDHGLTSAQVLEQRKKYGANVLETQQRESWLRVFWNNFCSGIVLLLLVAAVVAMSFQEWYQGSVILIILFGNSLFATYSEISAGNALNRLANLTAPKCRVIRNGGNVEEIDTYDLVPGDIIVLYTGDIIPADLRCLSAIELDVNEAILTGESVNVRKGIVSTDTQNPFPSNLCFATTSVTSGSGTGLVYSTGMSTEVGKIAQHLAKSSRKKQMTPLQRALNRLSGVIAATSIVVLILIVIIATVTGYRDPSHKRNDRFLDIFLVGVGFCVSSIPEGLPMIVTICLTLGCRDIAKKNGNIRKLTAIEALGSCSIICSDKTGTLTEGKMTCVETTIFCRNLPEVEKNNLKMTPETKKCFLEDQPKPNNFLCPLVFYPTAGFSPYGDLYLKGASPNVHVQNGEFTSVQFSDASHVDSQGKSILQRDASDPVKSISTSMALAGFLCSCEAKLYFDKDCRQWKTRGNTSEIAILVAAAKCGWGTDDLLISQGKVVDPTMEYVENNRLRIPFTSTRKMMCTIHRLAQPNRFHSLRLQEEGNSETSGESTFNYIALLKGAPERLIDVAQTSLALSSIDRQVFIDWHGPTLHRDEVDHMAHCNASMAKDALRVLAIALVPLHDSIVENTLKNCNSADERLDVVLAQKGITLLGLYGSQDPARHGVKESVLTCHNAGIRVVMITGDQHLTASAVASNIGILNFPIHQSSQPAPETALYLSSSSAEMNKSCLPQNKQIISCSDLHINGNWFENYLEEQVLDRLVDQTLVFCRAQPQDKLMIVESLQRLGHVVAMTGDGVNDAPALQSADIGVAMGITGTDVAKGAADLVLLDDNFSTIVTSIGEGRRIYGNIRKFVSFLLGTNIGEIVYLSVSIACGLKMPVESLQILFLNLMSDGCPAVALTREPPDADYMKKPPRNRNEGIMNRDWWLYSNIPHIVFEAICVLACLVISAYLSTGVITVKDILSQCHTKNNINYYCQTSSYLFSHSASAVNGSGFYTSIDYWDPTDQAFHYKPYALFNRSWNAELFPKDFVDVPGCGNDQNEWCSPESISQVPKDYLWVNARQTRIASTQTFITAVYSEMLRAYSISTWDFFLLTFMRNPWMHLGCSISAVCTILVTLIPGVYDIFNLHPLFLWQYAMAIGWAVLSLVLDEGIAKPLYRRHLRRLQRKESMKAVAS